VRWRTGFTPGANRPNRARGNLPNAAPAKDMPLVVKRKLSETWRDAVARRAREFGVEQECLLAYEERVREGMHEAEAAFRALESFEGLFIVPDGPVPGRREAL
jgi:hypothetical protein